MPSPRPVIESNSNPYVRWKKLGCHKYQFENLTSNATLRVELWRLDGAKRDKVWEAVLPPTSLSAPLDLKLDTRTLEKGDGVYQIVTRPFLPTIVSSTTLNATTVSSSYIPLVFFDNDDVITEIKDGTTTLWSGSATLATINQVLTALAGINGTAVLLPANSNDPNNPLWTPNSAPTILWQTTNGAKATTATFVIDGEQMTIDALRWCATTIPTAGTDPEYWITRFTVAGQNILTQYYDVRYQYNAFLQAVQQWLDANGGGLIVTTPNFVIYQNNCQAIQSLTYSRLRDDEAETLYDYIYELCDFFACYMKLYQAYICKNPCASACDAMERNLTSEFSELMTLSSSFFLGVIANAGVHRLNEFGDMGFYESSLTRAVDTSVLFSNLRQRVAKCGKLCADVPCGGCGK